MRRIAVMGIIVALSWGHARAEVVEYHLTIAETPVNFTGKSRMAITVNGGIPAPTLTFREGDVARIHVTNAMRDEASIHWHGLLLPNRMDGVPFITYPPIKPGETFDYEFPLRQHGTYWYHSHTKLHEQKGVYGALRILPRASRLAGDIDRTVVLSDWIDGSAQETLRWLKRGSDYPALQRGNAQSLLGALRAGRLGDYWKRELLRMPPMDLADVAYNRFLANGEEDHVIPARAGQRVRLRIVDGSSSTFFHLQFAGGPMTIASADGQDVLPLRKDRVLISVAETYDVLVSLPGPGAYELRATAHDGSAWTSIWIGQGERHAAPTVPHPDLYRSMGQLKPATIFALTPGGVMGMPDRKVDMGMFDKPGVMGGMMSMEEMMGGEHKMQGAHGKHTMKMPMHGMPMHHSQHGKPKDGMPEAAMEASGNPKDGRKHTWDFLPLGPDISARQPRAMDGMGPRPGPPYKELRSTKITALAPGRPLRIVRLTLDGDMERYVWELNGKPLFAHDDILIREGETVRFIMINRTMMHHPMHLHGHFFRVINGQGERSPLKHTVDVPPMQTTVIEFAAEEVGDWFFHCHLLYHLESGMARVVQYDGFEPYPDTKAVRHKLYGDPFYFWGNADLMSHMTQGYLQLSNTQNIFNLEWEAGWNKVPGTELELTLLYERYWNRFFRLLGGVNHEATITSDPARYEEEFTRGVLGIMYKLPLNIDATAWVDTDGGWRVRFAKEIALTPRLMLGGEFRYDSHEKWEKRAHVDYMLTRSISLTGQWHSDYGWGAGVSMRF